MGQEPSNLKPEDFHLKPQDFYDIRQRTNFTDDEIIEWYKSFFSEYPNGHIPIERFKEISGNVFSCGDSSRFAEHAFRLYDKDGNGILDFREFLIALYITSRGRTDQKIKMAFLLYDIDGDGYISIDEMREIIRSIHYAKGLIKKPKDVRSSQRHASLLFKELDKNKDKKISFNEFENYIYLNKPISKFLRENPLSST